MILLASTSDELRLTTQLASNVDVFATWVDGVTTIAPGRTDTLITTATTTVVVASPGASTYRTLKTLTVRNRSATATNRVTLIHRATGPVDAELISVVLSPGSTLTYDENSGFLLRSSSGVPCALVEVQATPTAGVLYTSVLNQDFAVAHATASRQADCKSLGFPVVDGLRYWFRFNLFYTSAATTTGGRFNIYGPGAPTLIRYRIDWSLTTTSRTSNDGLTVYDQTTANATSAATASNVAIIEGHYDTATCPGNVFLRVGSEVASSAITVKAGSNVQWQRVT